ncbi:MAG TPA: thioester reductase [Acidimicrobiaceae bacterium]|nr:thioester reductase [Acidimicrobiaceae bacterium]
MTAAVDVSPAGGVGILGGFHRSVTARPDRPALRVAGQELTYGDLHGRSSALAVALDRNDTDPLARRTAVLAHRSPAAYVGVLATLYSGRSYVPLNPRFPVQRIADALERSGASSLIVDEQGEHALDHLLRARPEGYLVILPHRADVRDLSSRFPDHRILGTSELTFPPAEQREPMRAEGAEAYLLFTSGSTGRPKGVPITDDNVLAYVRAVTERLQLQEHDRCSQTFDLTFDPSVHDLFVTWERGACVCVPSDKQLLKPSGFIAQEQLTAWFGVPSLAVLMRRLGGLKPGAYPVLRLVLFAGEALPVNVARDFAAAAPNAEVLNLYGPTEATIACTAYRWDPATSATEDARIGVVSIGRPLPGVDALVVDEALHPTSVGEPGELLVSGAQIAGGYLDDDDRTAAAFVVPPGQSTIHYRTGDRAVAGSDGLIHFLGRIDSQVKINGHRVELGEVEAALREIRAVDEAVVVAWPETGLSTATGLVGFVSLSADSDRASGAIGNELKAALTARLPSYMVPRSIRVLPALPKNVNGKYDRSTLRASLEATDE